MVMDETGHPMGFTRNFHHVRHHGHPHHQQQFHLHHQQQRKPLSTVNGGQQHINGHIRLNGLSNGNVPHYKMNGGGHHHMNGGVAGHNGLSSEPGLSTVITSIGQQKSSHHNHHNHHQHRLNHHHHQPTHHQPPPPPPPPPTMTATATQPQVNGGPPQINTTSAPHPSSSSASSSSSSHYNYAYLRRICRERGILFEDPTFPTNNRSLFGRKEVPSSSSCNFLNKISSSIVWMRPYEICSRPKFQPTESPTSTGNCFDVEQGEAIIAITAAISNGKGSSNPASGLLPGLSIPNHGNGNVMGNGNISATASSASPVSISPKTTCSSLLSAISCLTLTPALLERVVPSDQSFAPSAYSGIFRFRFWRFGDWTEVVIDDRLPTYKGRLLFLRSADPTEFWVALLEKAYSKMYGSYEYYLRNCFTAQTLQDLTGGIAQSFTIPHHDGHIIYQMISSAVPRSTLLSACIASTPGSEAVPASLLSLGSPNVSVSGNPYTPFSSSSSSGLSVAMSKLQSARLRNGLITRQTYSITGLARVRTTTRLGMSSAGSHPHHPHAYGGGHVGHISTGMIPNGGLPVTAGGSSASLEIVLIRLKNAWGKGEWNGPWSERSWEWDTLAERDKEELASRCRDDGEFWMSFDDFLRFFTHLDLVHIGPDDWMAESTLHHKRPWRAVLARRRWRHGFNAGGSPDYKDTFATNPQFHIHIPKNGLNKCHVVVSVTQQYVPNGLSAISSGHLSGSSSGLTAAVSSAMTGSGRNQSALTVTLHPIGFCVYEVPPGVKRLTTGFVAAHRPLDVTAFTCTRETVTFFTLPPGDFIIVPSTEKPHCETKFLLRILTDEPSTIWEVNDDNTIFTDISIPKVIENTGQNGHNVLSRLISKLPAEIDATLLLKILKAYWKPLNILYDKPSMELCRCLIMLKDATITGKLIVSESLASLLNMLHFWRTIFTKHQSNSHHKISSYNFRLVLWEAGISVSNKVLECLVIRYANNCALLNLESYLLSLVKLHLAHDRYRSLEKKGKNSNLTLEEMILLTTYS